MYWAEVKNIDCIPWDKDIDCMSEIKINVYWLYLRWKINEY